MTRKMIDSEDDSEILDEIRALEDVLAKDDWSTPSSIRNDVTLCNLSSRRLNAPSRGFGEVTPYRESEVVVTDVAVPRTAYETNKKLIELLQEAKRELLTILEKCIENKAILEEKIRITAINTKTSKIQIGAAGMPYFKDAKHFFAPRNKDAVTKVQKNELQIVQLRLTCPWTPHDRNVLWRSIRHEAAATVLRTKSLDDGETSNHSNDENRQSESLNLPKNFKSMIGPLDSREFDWLKIAATDFDNRHTPDECRVMWRVFLHPDINRYKWTQEEDRNIEKLSKRYKHQDWETIAAELGTRRSGYQCFIRYNTNNSATYFKVDQWTPEEDAKLRRCVEKFQTGHYISWGNVAKYMNGRSKNQVYNRWNAVPNLKKGRFTADEDAKLLEAVAKWGQNFGRISEQVMPNRSCAQLSDHYQTLVQRERGVRNSWSVGEDAKLLKLYAKYGTDWSNIAIKLPGKTRTQVRHRHKAILRYWDRGISLYSIRRTYDKSEASNDADTKIIDRLERERDEQRISNYSSETQKIDSELLKFFHLAPPPAKPGRKQIYYKEEELKNTTRVLNILLRTLGADLAIPGELDHRDLSEKDKQLLRSLKDYQQLQIEYAKVSSKAIECARMKLFGSDNGGERHFAPLCSGNCNPKEKIRINDTIDYRDARNSDLCRVTLEMKFDTPKLVIELIGDEKNDEFDKLMKIFRIPETKRRKNYIETIYILPPKDISMALSAIETSPRDSRSCETNRETIGAMRNQKERCAGGVESGECRIWEGIIHHEDQYSNCVAPSYHTLLGLQHIISERKTPKNSESSRSELPTSEKAARAMILFKKRLLQLFKYPILLSNLIPPPIYNESIDSTTLLDCRTNVFDDDADDGDASSSLTKRRRLTDGDKILRPKNQRRGRRR